MNPLRPVSTPLAPPPPTSEIEIVTAEAGEPVPAQHVPDGMPRSRSSSSSSQPASPVRNAVPATSSRLRGLDDATSPGPEGLHGGVGRSPLLRESRIRLKETASTAASLAARTAAALRHGLRRVDARTMVTRGDDAAFIAALRGDGSAESTTPARLPQLRQSVAEMRRELAESDAPAAIKTHFAARLKHVDETLAAMQTDQPGIVRAGVYLAMNVLLAPGPLAIPLQTHQNKFEAELVGLYAKTALMAIGSARSPTATNKHSLIDHFMSRHYINVVQGVIFAVPAFSRKFRKLNDDLRFNAAAGTVSTAALMGGFFGKEIKDMVNKFFRGSPNPALHAAGEGLQPHTRQRLELVMQTTLAGKDALMSAKNDFDAQGKELSPSTSKQVTMAANAFLAIADEMSDALHTRGETVPHQNPDLKAKLALAAFTAMVCATTTGLMYPDKIGIVDLGSDAVFTAALMTHHALNPNVTRTDALEEFKSFAGLSLVMIALLTADRAAGQFIDRDSKGLMIGSLAMAMLNVTIPGPVGHVAGATLEKLMSLKPSDVCEAVKAVGHNALEFFRGMAQPPRSTSVRLEEIPASPSQTEAAAGGDRRRAIQRRPSAATGLAGT